MTRSIGLRGVTDPDVLRRLAPRIESAGYHGLWLNDARLESLDALAAVAEVTSSLGLASGVIAVDRSSAEDIATRIDERRLPTDRLRLGVGSGASPRGLGLVRSAVDELRERIDAPIVVGALGPRMRRLAAEVADGVLLSWLTPQAARAAIAELRAQTPVDRAASGILYARTIAEPAAADALAAEAAAYASYPNYAANFARLGIDPIDTTVDLEADPAGPRGIAALEAVVDELVLRVITPTMSESEILRVIESGSPSGEPDRAR